MSPKTKRRLRIAAVLISVMVVLIPLAWLGAPVFLTVDTGLPESSTTIDAIVVLGGEPWTRPQRAAEVYAEVFKARQKTGEGEQTLEPQDDHDFVTRRLAVALEPFVIASGHGDCEDVRRQLEARHVPAAAIITECESTSTFENARFSVKLLRERHATNVVVVTSWFHSRRALACFEEAAPEMHFYSRPTQRSEQKSWWPNKYERDRILREYAKVVYYWFVHGVSPFV